LSTRTATQFTYNEFLVTAFVMFVPILRHMVVIETMIWELISEVGYVYSKV